jgi:hypothetical protein
MALERLPGERDLCSQSTVSRLENLPDRRMLLKMARAMVGLYCASFAQVPKRIVLDIDDTFDAVPGDQQLRLFNAHYDDYGFQPIVVFDGAGRFVTAVLRPARRPKGREIAAHLRRLIREIRSHWPRVEILLRGDGHYCAPEVLAALEGLHNRPGRDRRRRHCPGSRNSTTAPRPGAGWSASSPASRPVRSAATPASSYQPDQGHRQGNLRTPLLRPRPGRKPHQGLESAPRRRSHLLHVSSDIRNWPGGDTKIWPPLRLMRFRFQERQRTS